MKKLFKSISLLLALVLVFTAVPTMNADAASKVKLNKTTVTLEKGKTTTLKVTGTKKKVKWSSSNEKIATVNQKGKVTAKKKGTATITAKVSGKKYTCKVTVKDKSSGKFPYKVGKLYDNGGINMYYYRRGLTGSSPDIDMFWLLIERTKYGNLSVKTQSDYIGMYGGEDYYKIYPAEVKVNGKVLMKLENKPKSKCPYKTYKVYDKGDMNVYFYYTVDNTETDGNKPKSKTKYSKCQNKLRDIFNERYGGEEGCGGRDFAYEYVGTYGGEKYYKAYSSYVKNMKGKVVAQYTYKNSRK